MNAKRSMMVALFAAGAALSANAVVVYKNTSTSDARVVQTGCTYANAITNKVSFGMWLKDIDLATANPDVALGGTCHVNFNTSKGRGFALVLKPQSKQVRAYVIGENAEGTKSLCSAIGNVNLDWCTDGKWHFLMLTADCDAKEVKLYLDGGCVATQTMDFVKITPERCLQFGSGLSNNTTDTASPARNSYGCSAICKYAEVTLYDSVLSATDVADLKTHRANSFHAHLIGYWPCNETTTAVQNWAYHATTRSDGSAVGATSYYVSYPDDADFFPLPTGRFLVTPAWAEAHGYVQAADTPANTLACPATNLTYAFSKLANNETLNILPGVHEQAAKLEYTKTGTTLASYDPATGKGDRTGTIIDCLDSGSTFVAKNNGSFNPGFRELTFRNGERALQFESAGVARIDSCTFTNFTTTGMGAAIMSYISNGTLITNCLFQACTGRNGGAIYTMQNNRLSASDYQTVVDCRFESCRATQAGSGDPGGGAIFGARNVRVLGCTFKDCSAYKQDGAGIGGAIAAGAYSTIAGCTFTGACYARGRDGAYGGIMDLRYRTTVSNCVITGISEFYGGYGAIHYGSTDGYSGGDTVYGLVCTNNAINAGLLFLEGSAETVTLRNSLVAKGGSTGPQALVTGHNSKRAVFEQVTCDLDAVTFGSGNYTTNVFVNCIVRGTFGDGGKHYSIVSNSIVSVARSGADDSNAWLRTPGFVDAAQGDYSLRPGAFARDKGLKLGWQTAVSLDLAGLPRLVNRAGVAGAADALPDLGCYEAQLPAPGLLLMLK